jgi:hypothetical protein
MLERDDSERCDEDCEVCSGLRLAAASLVARFGFEGVDDEALAAAVGRSGVELSAHVCGTARVAIARAYTEGAGRLQASFIERLSAGETWRDGLSAAIMGVAADAEDDPDVVRLCCVEVFQGDRDMQRLCHDARERSIILLGREWIRRHEGAPPMLHLELLWGAVVQAVASGTTKPHALTLAERLEGARYLAMAGAPAAAVVV